MPVVATTLTQDTNDKQQVEPMLSELKALQDNLGKPGTLLAGNGYFSKDNIQACVNQKIAPLIALGREAHHLPLEQRLAPDAPEPETTDRWSKWPGNSKPRVVARFTASAEARSNRCLGSLNRCWAFANSR